MVMVGKNVKSSVIGGVTTVSGAGQASAIDSTTGKPTTASGATVIPNTMTHVAAARTLGVALGIPSGTLDAAFISSAATGKVVNAALSGVSG
jgi:ABC-type antimicrobial peptide transport system permease subunit